MDPAADEPTGSPVLRFFGLETAEKALSVVGWTAPYLAVLCGGFAGLSYLVHQIMPLPLWVYLLASGLGIVYFFLFLARLREMGNQAHARSLAPDEEQEVP